MSGSAYGLRTSSANAFAPTSIANAPRSRTRSSSAPPPVMRGCCITLVENDHARWPRAPKSAKSFRKWQSARFELVCATVSTYHMGRTFSVVAETIGPVVVDPGSPKTSKRTFTSFTHRLWSLSVFVSCAGLEERQLCRERAVQPQAEAREWGTAARPACLRSGQAKEPGRAVLPTHTQHIHNSHNTHTLQRGTHSAAFSCPRGWSAGSR